MVQTSQTHNGPSISWANIISTLAFGVIVIGAGWTVMLTLFAGERERNTLITSFRDKQIAALQAADNRLAEFQHEKFDLMQAQIDRSEADLRRRLMEIEEHRREYLTRSEFTLFRDSFTSLRERIDTIEKTRPTTGELQAVGSATSSQLTKIEERIRSLEDNLRRSPIR